MAPLCRKLRNRPEPASDPEQTRLGENEQAWGAEGRLTEERGAQPEGTRGTNGSRRGRRGSEGLPASLTSRLLHALAPPHTRPRLCTPWPRPASAPSPGRPGPVPHSATPLHALATPRFGPASARHGHAPLRTRLLHALGPAPHSATPLHDLAPPRFGPASAAWPRPASAPPPRACPGGWPLLQLGGAAQHPPPGARELGGDQS